MRPESFRQLEFLFLPASWLESFSCRLLPASSGSEQVAARQLQILSDISPPVRRDISQDISRRDITAAQHTMLCFSQQSFATLVGWWIWSRI